MTVLDSSALLAYLFDEPGSDVVESTLAEMAAIGSINLAEVLTRLVESGADADAAWATVQALPLGFVDAGSPLALEVARLRPPTRSAGLSLGDRACLALARARKAAVLTADQRWRGLDVGVDIRVIR